MERLEHTCRYSTFESAVSYRIIIELGSTMQSDFAKQSLQVCCSDEVQAQMHRKGAAVVVYR